MTLYDFKVTITHAAVSTDYENTRFSSIRVTGRENDVSSAILIADNKNSEFYPDYVDVFDAIQIYVRKDGGSYTEIFDGTIRECDPTLANQAIITLKCKGLGQALLETHCNREYGHQSVSTIDTVKAILVDLVDFMINSSYGDFGNPTGYVLFKDFIDDVDPALSIAFLNSPYQLNKEVIDRLCMVDTAYRNGVTAGPHYFVDNAGFLRVKTISDQQAGVGVIPTWGNYCGGSAAAVSLYEGVDFINYALSKPTDEYANSVVLATDLRKPAYDYWTENKVALWGNAGLDDLSVDNVTYVVGADSLNIDFDIAQSEAYYPSSKDAAWDITKWGSERTIPRLNFYFRRTTVNSLTTVYLFTDDENGANSYSLNPLLPFGSLAADTWHHISIPIGQYWASDEENKQYRWTQLGAGDWSNINGVSFSGIETGAADEIWIDDLHFTGKIIREAVDTSEVTSYKEHQKTFLSRTALDDSCTALDDTGMAGYYTLAELLRRVTIPRTLSFTIPIRPELLPGEYFRIYAGKTGSGTYKINGVDFRTIQYVHNVDVNTGFTTTVACTDDLKNSFPINPVNMREILNEYLLVNNAKATDMKGGDVDLLIQHLRKPY